MGSILDRIEDHLASGNTSAGFTFYTDEGGQRRELTLSDVRRGALKIGSMLPRSVPVLIIQPDPLDFITSFFACLYAGAIAVPLALPTRRLGLEQLAARRAAVGAEHCLTNSNVLGRLRVRTGLNCWAIILSGSSRTIDGK